jgi:hypothetical protein
MAARACRDFVRTTGRERLAEPFGENTPGE